MRNTFLTRKWLVLTAVAVVAAVFYSSWPLGYWLNPVANRGLASNLEALHQPYNWLFIGLDIISGAMLCIVSWYLLKSLMLPKAKLLKTAVIGLALFGVLTALDAVLPLNCVATATVKCGPILEDPWFIIHGITSIGSVGGLTISIVVLWWLMIRDARVPQIVRMLLHLTMVVWFAFGVVTLWLTLADRNSALSQHIFISVCSLWCAALPYLIWENLQLRTAKQRVLIE